MYNRILVTPAALVAATLILASCSEPLGPDRSSESNSFGPRFAVVAPPVSNGLVLDQWNGTLSENPINPGTCDGNNPCFIKGFNPKNPHLGDAIVVTFYWTGATNIITSVTDHLTDVARTPVGNQYTLIKYVTDGRVSMATYVATNVQNFPDTSTDYSKILAVRANLSAAVSDGGLVMAAYSGLPVTIGPATSAQGTGTVPSVAAAGPVAAAAGGLVYSTTLSGTLVGLEHPAAPFADIAEMSDNFMKSDAVYSVFPNGATVNPQWTWFFSGAPANWLATSVALNPKATRLVITGQPSTTLPLMTITPGVRVSAVDDLGNEVTTFNGSVTIAIGHNGGLVVPGTLSGTKALNFVNGTATFADLSIDQAGNGYTLVVTGSGLRTAESNPFNIGAF